MVGKFSGIWNNVVKEKYRIKDPKFGDVILIYDSELPLVGVITHVDSSGFVAHLLDNEVPWDRFEEDIAEVQLKEEPENPFVGRYSCVLPVWFEVDSDDYIYVEKVGEIDVTMLERALKEAEQAMREYEYYFSKRFLDLEAVEARRLSKVLAKIEEEENE